MPKTTMTIDAWKCCRCGYIWKGRTKEKPLRCPNSDCGSCYWDRPRKNEEDRNEC